MVFHGTVLSKRALEALQALGLSALQQEVGLQNQDLAEAARGGNLHQPHLLGCLP